MLAQQCSQQLSQQDKSTLKHTEGQNRFSYESKKETLHSLFFKSFEPTSNVVAHPFKRQTMISPPAEMIDEQEKLKTCISNPIIPVSIGKKSKKSNQTLFG